MSIPLIPKKIHYCWFGGNPLPDIAHKCMESWEKFCPDYEIIRWDESNCDLQINDFVRGAVEHKKWAFVSDYFRLKVIEEHGGIYLDIDVELLKPFDNLLELEGFMGFELSKFNCINSGLGFGATPHNKIIQKLRENYEQASFVKKDGSLDMTPCPERDTKVLVQLGLKQIDKNQLIDKFMFLSSDYFSPIGLMGQENFTENTYSIHHFNASWFDEYQKEQLEFSRNMRSKYGNVLGYLCYKTILPFKIIRHYGIGYLFKKIYHKLTFSK